MNTVDPKKELRILLLEDSAIDADLLERELKRHGLAFSSRRVDTKEGLRDALTHFVPDLVLSDLSMPSLSGIDGLKITREMRPSVPYIYVSGTIGEERAIELLRQGATDYVHKSNLARLPSVVERALREAEAHRERRRTEEQLRKLSSAVEHSPAAIVITDAEGTIEYVNPKSLDITGYSAEEVLGQTLSILKVGEAPDSTYEELWRTIRAGGEWRGEFHNRRKNGEQFWEFASISGIRDDSGSITHFVAVKEDITERKSLQEQLLRTQRLEGIGTLASGVAHDLNNILAPILMSIPLLERALAGTKSASLVSTIEQCAERGAAIVKQVLTFARGVHGERIFVQVHHLLHDMGKIAHSTFPRSITIRNNSPGNLWPVNGDATQLHQVLLNLCVNARDAMPGGGSLTIDAGNLQIDENYAAMSPEAKPGPYLTFSVSDTGHGIPAGIMQKIFDPFFTTKEVGKGTGLGLSTVIGIVKNHGGFLTVESEPGKGTTFKVFLPAEPEAEAVPKAASRSKATPGNGELILVVDDESSVRSIAEAVLQANGYRVLLAGDGTEALAVFAQRSGDIAAVVTDIAMPFMDGAVLIRALRKMRPDIRVIVSTGHGEKAQVSELNVNGFLNKPYDAQTLLRALHTALAGRREALPV
jgi:PAS domain S-box-containing protein